MKINNINMNFGKSLIAKCNIQDKDKQVKPASLYEYNPRNYYDKEEIESLYAEGDINKGFYRSFFTNDYSKFFILKDDTTDEIIASSEATNRISLDNPVVGNHIEINNMRADKNYRKPLTPIVANISRIARLNKMDNIVAYGSKVDSSNLKGYGFKEVKYDTWIMPKKNFSNNIKKAEKNNSVDYCI